MLVKRATCMTSPIELKAAVVIIMLVFVSYSQFVLDDHVRGGTHFIGRTTRCWLHRTNWLQVSWEWTNVKLAPDSPASYSRIWGWWIWCQFHVGWEPAVWCHVYTLHQATDTATVDFNASVIQVIEHTPQVTKYTTRASIQQHAIANVWPW